MDRHQREYSPLESIEDWKVCGSLDDIAFPSNKGIKHMQAYGDFSNLL